MKPSTTDDLRKLTGAPATEPPLLTAQEFSAAAVRSPRPTWAKPLPKLMMACLLLTPVFVIAAAFLVGGGHSRSPGQALPDSSTQAKAKPDATVDAAEQMRQENARLKSKAALEGQQQLEKQLAKQPNGKPIQSAQKALPETSKASASPPTAPSTVAIHSEPPALATAPMPPPVVRSATPESRDRPAANSTESIDPEQRWQQLARLGSYGSVQPESLATQPEWSNTSRTQTDLNETTHATTRLATTEMPRAVIAATSAVQRDDPATWVGWHPDADAVIVPTVETEEAIPPVPSTSPAILSAAESRILNDRSAPTTIAPAALIAGTNAPGVLTTPLVLDDTKTADHFAVTLSQPLQDSSGQTALPANTQLIVQVEGISEAGRVQLSATTATWHQDGLAKELDLPPGVIQVRGVNGQPLIAQQFTDKGREIAALDSGQFLLGAVRGAAAQFTQSNTRVENSNNTTVVTQENQRPNILAGALKGGTDAILDTISERNRSAVAAIQKRPPIRYIKAGSPVQVFVNQSMLMPS